MEFCKKQKGGAKERRDKEWWNKPRAYFSKTIIMMASLIYLSLSVIVFQNKKKVKIIESNFFFICILFHIKTESYIASKKNKNNWAFSLICVHFFNKVWKLLSLKFISLLERCLNAFINTYYTIQVILNKLEPYFACKSTN